MNIYKCPLSSKCIQYDIIGAVVVGPYDLRKLVSIVNISSW